LVAACQELLVVWSSGTDLSFVKEGSDHAFEGLRRSEWRETLPDIAISVHEKFGEIPFDSFAAHEPWGLFLKLLIKRVAIVPIDLHFLMDRELNLVLGLAKRHDVCVRSRLLLSKLIARKGQHAKAHVMILLMEHLKT